MLYIFLHILKYFNKYYILLCDKSFLNKINIHCLIIIILAKWYNNF